MDTLFCRAGSVLGRMTARLAIGLVAVLVLAGNVPDLSSALRDDDYYEDFYLRRVPKLKVSPEKVKQFFVNHLSWFPMDDLRGGAEGESLAYHRQHKSVPDPAAARKVKYSLKNFTANHKGIFAGNFSSLKNDSAKVKAAISNAHVPGKVKNMTHPFRPRNNDHQHTTQLRYMTATTKSTSTTEPYRRTTHPGGGPGRPCRVIGPTVRIHRNGFPARALRKMRLTNHPKRLKVVIDVDAAEEGRRKVERHAKQMPNETESNNSSHVLETAEEMATDLAGRVTNLWKCVVRSHRNPQVRDVKYFLYTRRNVIEPEILSVNYDLIRNKSSGAKQAEVDCADVNPQDIDDFKRVSDEHRKIIKSNFLSLRAPTKILIHGYTGSYKDSRMARIKDEYLSTGRYNVIQVDWEMLAAPPCYIRVTHHSRFVGETVARFIDGLYLIGMNMSLVHLVGFSLGAQVAGFAGNLVTTTKICRITGLDPALPLFLHTDSSGHLDKTDAEFVDVIHTCGGILAMYDPLGHVDFYPNGGSRQPGCEFSNLKCSHSRAPQYFAESVSSKRKFTGQLCPSWEEFVSGECNSTTKTSMGEPCSIRSERGKYYLTTKSREPFAV